MRHILTALFTLALLGLCVVVSAKDVFGLKDPLGDYIDTEIFALVLAAMAQTVLIFFVSRQITKEEKREGRRQSYQQASVIADFLAACTTTSTLYTQAAPHAEAFVKDLKSSEKQQLLQQEINSIEPSRQIAHSQKVRVFIFAGEETKQNALKLINHIDAQRRKAVGCLTWPKRVLIPGSEPPDSTSIRRALPEEAVESLEREASDAFKGS